MEHKQRACNNTKTTNDCKYPALSSAGQRYGDTTFYEAVVRYLEAGGEDRYFTEILLDILGHLKLSEIEQSHIDHAAMVICPTSAPSTQNRQVYTPVSAALKFAWKEGLCTYRRVRRPKLVKQQPRLPTSDELDRFVKRCSPALKPIVLFLLYTGASVHETLHLHWHHVDLNTRTAQLRAKKTQSDRIVTLHPRITELLAKTELPSRQGRVFRRPDGRGYTPKQEGGGQLKSAFRGTSERAGIPPISPRTLRHIWVRRRQQLDFIPCFVERALRLPASESIPGQAVVDVTNERDSYVS